MNELERQLHDNKLLAPIPISSTDPVEGEFISADEWNEDQFNKSIPDPISAQAEALRHARAANALNTSIQRQYMFNQGMNAQQQGFNQGYSDSVLDSVLGGGGLFGNLFK